jgi:hypothetical protein
MNKLLVLIIFFNFAFAEEMIPYVSPTLEKPYSEIIPEIKIPELEQVPPIENYEKFLLLLKDNSENFSNIEFYENVKIQLDGDIKKIKDFDKTKINLFLIYQGEALSDTMCALQILWKDQISTTKDDIKKRQLSKYSVILFEIRKDHAIFLEKEIEKLLGEITEISEEEKLDYIQKIKNWNSINKLTKE